MPHYTVLDFETFYDREYSLRRMTPAEYILDARFECMGAGVIEGDDGEPFWLDEPDLRAYLKSKHAAQARGEKLVVVSHNALFDMCLLAWRYYLVPDLMIDTMGMARAMGVYARTGSVSLDSVSRHLGLGLKGKTILKVQGLRAAAIKSAGLWDEYTTYARNDADLCREVLKRLRVAFPPEEYLVLDTVLRCAVTPRFKVDAGLLHEYAAIIRGRKEGLLDRCGIGKDELMSADKFAEALRRLGVEPETKTSPTTGEQIYAFAKSDQAMADLEEHEDPDVQALVAARLGHKSTQAETRAQRFISIARLAWPVGEGWMPVPLRYSGAHTHRLSGDWGLNLQNLPRPSPKDPLPGKLRHSLVAPEGHAVVAGDSSQIEARIVAWLAGCEPLLEAFRAGADVYSKFGTEHVYHRPISKDTPLERFVSKQCLAEGTLVLTDRGWVEIQHITTQHRVWDGVEWVCHDGVLSNGLKPTLPLCGVWLTPDHLVLSGTRWREAQFLAQDVDGLFQALAIGAASLPSQAICEGCEAASPPSLSNAIADDLNTQSVHTVSRRSEPRVATYARWKKHNSIAGCITAILRIWLRTIIERAFSIVCPQRSFVATTLKLDTSIIMVGGASRFIRDGETIGVSSFGMSRPFQDGMYRSLNLTASTSTATTNRGTSASSPRRRTTATRDASPTLRLRSPYSERKLPVYDIASAGPRHRFTVWSEAGPLIVHNCILGLGFSMSAPRFQAQLKKDSRIQLGEAIDMPIEEAWRIVRAYRTAYKPIPDTWYLLQEKLIPHMSEPGRTPIELGPVRFEHQAVRLPSGLRLHYPELRLELTPRGNEWMYRQGRKPSVRLFGGKLFENIVQALARIINTTAMLEMRRRFPKVPLALQSHDELVYVPSVHLAEELRAALLEIMARQPSWAPGLPLAAEAGKPGRSYGEVK